MHNDRDPLKQTTSLSTVIICYNNINSSGRVRVQQWFAEHNEKQTIREHSRRI